jgi:anti-sigma regulatory factor (Ser/Thr protein kinase)
MTSPAPDGSPPELPELQLDLPARPEYVRTARHTIVALARLHEVEDDVLEDIRLAVSEAVTTAIRGEEVEGRRLSVSARVEDEHMAVDVDAPGAALARAIEGDPEDIDTADLPFESALAVPIIRGLADEVSVTPTADGTRIGITVSLTPSPAAGATP